MVVSVTMPPREGIGFYVWNLSRFLVGQSHQVHIITRSQGKQPFHEELEEIQIWRPRFFPIYPLHVYLHALFVQNLVKQLDAEVDLFHLHTPLPPPVRTKRPVLLTVHSLMLADARARKVDSVYDLLTKLQSPVSSLIEKQLFHISRKVTAVSPPVAEQVQHFLPQKKRRVEITWNGVDSRFFSPGNQDCSNPSELLFVGRLAPGKGLHDLILAFKIVIVQFPNVKLSIVGDGPLYSKMLSMIEQNGLKNHVRLIGHISSREALRAFYQQAWGFILPSHHESLPGVILEAMACGTPVIATRVGGIPAVINNGVNGFLVSPRAPDALAGAICRLLKDDGFHSKLGQAARQTVEKQFSWNIIGENYLNCYNEISAGVPLRTYA